MERCVCQICICKGHKCKFNGTEKDLLGQRAGYQKLPITESHDEYYEYPSNYYVPKSSIQPVGADAERTTNIIYDTKPYMRHIDRPFIKMPSGDFGESEKRKAQAKENQRKIEEQAKKYGDYIEWKFTPKIKEVIPEPDVQLKPRKDLKLPPFNGLTMFTHAYRKPISLKTYTERMPQKYEPPLIPMEEQSMYLKEYKKWDLNLKLVAPVPERKDNLCTYDVPLDHLTIFRESYAAPPIDISKVKLQLKENPSDDRPKLPLQDVYKCEYHNSPEEKFAHRILYRTAYRESYLPPCYYEDGDCSLKPSKPEDGEQILIYKECPAREIVDNNYHDTKHFKYVQTCCGHQIFKKQENIRT